MASVRAQILALVEVKLGLVAEALDWAGVLRNPRDPVGEDQLNAIVQMDGGDRDPNGLTGRVEQRWLEFSVGLLVQQTSTATAEELLDDGLVAVSDSLLDPTDIQLGALAVGIEQGAVSDPVIGRAQDGGRVLGGQSIDFTVQYLAREGDASTPGP